MSNIMTERALGMRFFTKEDGKVYLTVPTGKFEADGKTPVFVDQLWSESRIDANAALTLTEYKRIDTVLTEIRNAPDRITTWMRGLTGCVDSFDGMADMMYWYRRATAQGSSRPTMLLEDDAPNTTISTEEDGIPLPLEFADWQSSLRGDASTSKASGMDVAAQKAAACGEAVAKGLDLRQVNGWGGLEYRGKKVYGFRDVPTGLTVTQTGTVGAGGWLSTNVSVKDIFANIRSAVRLADLAKIPGPFVLVLPMSFRDRLAESYSTDLNGVDKSLWMKILEKPGASIPNVLNISEIKLLSQMNELKGGAAPTCGEAYLLSLSPMYFRVLNYCPTQSLTIDLKGSVATKHRVFEGVCPLFKTDAAGNYGIVKLAAPAE